MNASDRTPAEDEGPLSRGASPEPSQTTTFRHPKLPGDLTGQELGDYLVIEPIGSGGGGQVYKANHRHMGRTVAIKVLPPDATSDPVFQQRFLREVWAAAQLLHPNIVTAFDSRTHGTLHYLVMEFVTGKSLADLVRTEGLFSIAHAVDFTMKIASGLAHAHRKGIVHRDVKPSNIMLSEDGEIKILDMGLARISELTIHEDAVAGRALTEHGIVIGSLGYMSPEQATSAQHVDHRTDIYSLGCTLHYLLTGSPPYSGSLWQTIAAQAKDPIPSLRRYRSDVPIQLDETFQQMIAVDVADRLQRMDDVIEHLRPFLACDSSIPLVEPVAKSSRAVRDSKQTAEAGFSIVNKSIGFDLGTMRSYVSYISTDGTPQSIRNVSGHVSTPTVVRFRDGRFDCGQSVVDDLTLGVEDVAAHFIGKLGVEDQTLPMAGRPVPPEVAAAVLVRSLAGDTRRHVGYFSHACYTLPTCFGERRRRAYRQAFDIGAVHCLAPLNSATASGAYFAFMHGWLNPIRSVPPKTLLVVRYGASSFDASLLQVSNQHLQTLAVIGEPAFGGQQWTERMIEYVAGQIAEQHQVNVHDDPVELFRLRESCEQAKLALTGQERVELRFRSRKGALGGTLSRSFLQRLCQDLLTKLESLVTTPLTSANVDFNRVDYVLLSGGAAHMPIVRDFLQSLAVVPEKCVVIDPVFAPHGAALYAQAQIESNCRTSRLTITELTAHYLGIESQQGGKKKRNVVVPVGAELPCSKVLKIKTSEPDQRSLQFQIIEGTEPSGKDCSYVGFCKIGNLPPGLPVGAPMQLEFRLAVDGTLSVAVESASTGQWTLLPIERSHGLGSDQTQQWRNWLDTGQLVGQFD